MRIVVLIALLVLACTDTCGGNCPAGFCTNCYCGNQKNIVDIATWCAKYTWDQNCCKCIVSHESNGNANYLFYHNFNGSYDLGLFTINSGFWNNCNSGRNPPCDPNNNLNCAIALYETGGNSFKYWGSHAACGCWSIKPKLLIQIWYLLRCINCWRWGI